MQPLLSPKKLFVATRLALICSVLVGCGGGGGGSSSSSVIVEGSVVDGYVSGATVTFSGQTVQTDAQGRYSLTFESAPEPGMVSVQGGVDTATGEAFEGQLMAFVGDVTESTEAQVTPLTTLVSAEVSRQVAGGLNASQVDLAAVKNDLASSLGLAVATLDQDLIAEAATGSADAAEGLKKALMIQKSVEAYAKAALADPVAETSVIAATSIDIFEEIAESLVSAGNSDTALENALSANNVLSAFSDQAMRAQIASAAVSVQRIQNVIEELDESEMVGASAMEAIASQQKAIEFLTKDVEIALSRGDVQEAEESAALSALLGVSSVVEEISDQIENGQSEVSVEQLKTLFDDELEALKPQLSTPPTITLQGQASVAHEKGTNYTDAGAVATNVAGKSVNVVTEGLDDLDTTVSGTYTLTYRATDGAGNSAAAVTRQIVVSDTIAPVITLNGNANLRVEQGSAFEDPGVSITDLGSPTLTANVSGDTVDTDQNATYVLRYNVTDAEGNAATEVTREVVVSDTTRPVITLSGQAEMTLELGTEFDEPGVTANDSVDGILSVTTGGDTVDTSSVGTYVISYNVSDSAGNAALQVTRTVSVVDSTAPVISINGDNPVSIEFGSTYSDSGATASDASSNNVAVSVSGADVDTSALGSNTVTYTAVDASNNSASATRTVNVVDTTAPVITLAGDATVDVEFGSTYTDAGATVSDAADSSVTVSTSPESVATNALGSTVITYSATDASGNDATAVTRTVRVVDTTAPVITLAGDSTVDVEFGSTYTDAGATVTDAADSSVTVSASPASVATNALGSTVITYSATDASGNNATEVTRTVNVVDTTAPVITLLGADSIELQVGENFTDPGTDVIDAADDSVTVVVGGDTVDTSTVGTYTITYDATDDAGNIATQVTRTITVVDLSDTTAPSVTIAGGNEQTHEVNTTFTNPIATVVDDVDSDLSATVTGSVDTTALGDYTLTYTATDAAGNEGTATLTVSVVDTTAPTISFDDGETSAEHFFGTAFPHPASTVTDNYDTGLTAVVTGGPANDDVNALGDYDLTYTATDSSGNSSTATFTVTVVNTIQGSVVDGYVSGATVSFCGKEVTTDDNGGYTLTCDTPPASDAKSLEVKGGIDTATGEAFEGKLSAFVKPGSTEAEITPLTTVLEKAIQKEAAAVGGTDSVDIETIKQQVANNLNIDPSMLEKDLVDSSKSSDQSVATAAAAALKQALLIQKSVEAYAKSVAGSDDLDDVANQSDLIFEQVASKLSASGGSVSAALSSDNIAEAFSGDLSVDKVSNAATAVESIQTLIGDMEVADLTGSDVLTRLASKQKSIEVFTRKIEDALVSGDAEEANRLAVQSILMGGVNSIEDEIYAAKVGNNDDSQDLSVDGIDSVLQSKFQEADSLVSNMVTNGVNLTSDLDFTALMNSVGDDGRVDPASVWDAIDNSDFKNEFDLNSFSTGFNDFNSLDFDSNDFASGFSAFDGFSFDSYSSDKGVATDLAAAAANILTASTLGFSGSSDAFTAGNNFDLSKSITVPGGTVTGVVENQQLQISWQSWDPWTLQVIKRSDSATPDVAVVQHQNYSATATLVASIQATYNGRTSYESKYFYVSVPAGSGTPSGNSNSGGSGGSGGFGGFGGFGGGNSNVDRQAPTISIAGGTAMTIQVGAAFSYPQATVTDNVDTNLTATPSGQVDVNNEGTYEVTYRATDTAGNVGTEVLTVTVVQTITADTEAPVITISGASNPGDHSIEHTEGAQFSAPDASVTDNRDAGLQATTSGTVNINVPGSYTVTYSATDRSNNTGTATLTVTVVGITPPMPPTPSWAPAWTAQ